MSTAVSSTDRVAAVGPGERDAIWFNGALMESACCESADPPALARVVEALGLSGFANVNYLKAAKRVVGMA